MQQPNPQGNTPIDYAVEAQGPFEVVSGADSIPVTLSWDDLVGGQAATLQPNLSTAEIFTGAARYCPGGNNARLDVYASGTDIQAVPPGTYTSQFNFTATNSGRGKSSANFTVSVDITIPNSTILPAPKPFAFTRPMAASTRLPSPAAATAAPLS